MKKHITFKAVRKAKTSIRKKADFLILLLFILPILPVWSQNVISETWSGLYETRHTRHNGDKYEAKYEVAKLKDTQEIVGIIMILPEVEDARFEFEEINLEMGKLRFRIKTGEVYKRCETELVEGGGYEGSCIREGPGDTAVPTQIVLSPVVKESE